MPENQKKITMTKENDIVLIYVENTPVSFARVESIICDSKKDWYHIKLLFLQIPLQVVTWILKDTYINGEEFSMGGKKMRLELVKSPEEKDVVSQPEKTDKGGANKEKTDKNTVTPFKSKKKLKHQMSEKVSTDQQTKKMKKSDQNKKAKIISLADIRKTKNKK